VDYTAARRVDLPEHAPDPDNALVTITRQLTTAGYQPLIKDVKTPAVDRIVPANLPVACKAGTASWRQVTGEMFSASCRPVWPYATR
jgi:hypothetical protein